MVKRVCAWCEKEMGFATFKSHDPKYNITHGICLDCKDRVMTERKKPLMDFLDRFEQPIYLINKDMVIKTSNKNGVHLSNNISDIENIRLGNVLGCIFSNKEQECGNHDQCSGCALRKSVKETFVDNKGVNNITANLAISMSDEKEFARFSITTEKVGDIVFLQIDNPV